MATAPYFRIDDARPTPGTRRAPQRSILNTLRLEGLLFDDSAPVEIAVMDNPAVPGPIPAPGADPANPGTHGAPEQSGSEPGGGLESMNAMPRWANGITWEGDPCGDDGGLFDPCEGGTKTITDSGGPVEFAPVTAQSAVACTALTRGGIPDSDVARARALLNVEQHRFIGNEVWRGTLAQAANLPNVWLSDSDGLCQIASGVAVSVLDGLAALEEALYGLGDCACVPAVGQGMIHADPYTVSLWEASWTIIEIAPGLLRTRLGTIVVTGPGYDGSAPNGTIGDTTRWAYATPLVFGGLTQPKVLDPVFREMDRTNNQVPVYAERTIVFGWDPCCRVGVNIDLTTRC